MTEIESALCDPLWRVVVGEGQAAARIGQSRRHAPRRSAHARGVTAREVWLAAYNAELAKMRAKADEE